MFSSLSYKNRHLIVYCSGAYGHFNANRLEIFDRNCIVNVKISDFGTGWKDTPLFSFSEIIVMIGCKFLLQTTLKSTSGMAIRVSSNSEIKISLVGIAFFTRAGISKTVSFFFKAEKIGGCC